MIHPLVSTTIKSASTPRSPSRVHGDAFRSLVLVLGAVIACAQPAEWPQVLTIEPDGYLYRGKHTPGSPRDLFEDSMKPDAAFVIRRGEGTTTRHFADTLGFRVLVAPDARERLSLGLVDLAGEEILPPTVEPVWILLEGAEIRVAGFGVSTNALPNAIELGHFLDAVLADEGQEGVPWILSVGGGDPAIEADVRAVLSQKAKEPPVEVSWTPSGDP